MRKNPFNSKLLEKSVALGSYLDQLLHEATQDQAKADEEVKIAPLVEAEGLIGPELLVAGTDKPQPVTIADSDEQVQQVAGPEPEVISLEPELFPLQCLMFRVAGNLLAMPLVRMKSVVSWPQKLTSLPQSPDWMLGLFKYQDHKVRVVDSMQVLHLKPAPCSTPKYVLVLGDDEWAISCDKLEKVIKLEYSDIQWRQKPGESIIFGTVRNSLASLINPDAIVNSFKAFNLG